MKLLYSALVNASVAAEEVGVFTPSAFLMLVLAERMYTPSPAAAASPVTSKEILLPLIVARALAFWSSSFLLMPSSSSWALW